MSEDIEGWGYEKYEEDIKWMNEMDDNYRYLTTDVKTIHLT